MTEYLQSTCQLFPKNRVFRSRNRARTAIHQSRTSLSDSKPFSLSLLTSGSTGVPKIVQKTAYSLISEIFTWIVELNISRNTNTSVFQPIYYSAAWFYTFSTLAAGGSVHFGVRRPESIFLEELRASVSSHLILVPSQYRRLCEAFGKDEVLSLHQRPPINSHCWRENG